MPQNPSEWADLINYFHTQGVYVIAGVPHEWLTNTLPGFANVYAMCDAINPWVVGVFSGVGGADGYATTNLTPEKAWVCSEGGNVHIPCVWPASRQATDGGSSLSTYANGKYRSCFMSIFDEFNKDTQIMVICGRPTTDLQAGSGLPPLNSGGTRVSSGFLSQDRTSAGGSMMKGWSPLDGASGHCVVVDERRISWRLPHACATAMRQGSRLGGGQLGYEQSY